MTLVNIVAYCKVFTFKVRIFYEANNRIVVLKLTSIRYNCYTTPWYAFTNEPTCKLRTYLFCDWLKLRSRIPGVADYPGLFVSEFVDLCASIMCYDAPSSFSLYIRLHNNIVLTVLCSTSIHVRSIWVVICWDACVILAALALGHIWPYILGCNSKHTRPAYMSYVCVFLRHKSRGRRRSDFYVKSRKKRIHITLAGRLLHPLDTQFLQQNIQYVQQNMQMLLRQTSEQTFQGWLLPLVLSLW